MEENDKAAHDLHDIPDDLDQDVQALAAKLSKETPWFECIADCVLRKAQEMPKENREEYVIEAHRLGSILAGYDEEDRYFIGNFFVYLLDKTRNMDDERRRECIYVARSVRDSLMTAVDEKTGERQSIESIAAMIRPTASLVAHLGFDRNDYGRFRETLAYYVEGPVLAHSMFEQRFFTRETVADVVELIGEIKAIA